MFFAIKYIQMYMYIVIMALIRIVLQSNMGYMDLFAETWKAFTDYPIIRLHQYDKKIVSQI